MSTRNKVNLQYINCDNSRFVSQFCDNELYLNSLSIKTVSIVKEETIRMLMFALIAKISTNQVLLSLDEG